MKKMLVCLVVSSLMGCAGMSFQEQVAMVQARQKAAEAEIQRQKQIQNEVVTNSHNAWVRSLTPEQRAVYDAADTRRRTAQINQNTEVLRGAGQLFMRMFQ